MRNGMTQFKNYIAPVQYLLKAKMAKQGAKKANLAKFLLDETLWTKEPQDSFDKMKELITKRVELAHLDPNKHLCLHTDATDHFHAAVPTQIPHEDPK